MWLPCSSGQENMTPPRTQDYVMGDGSRFTGGINGYTPIIFHYMEYNLGDGFDVEAGTFYAPKGKTSMR